MTDYVGLCKCISYPKETHSVGMAVDRT